MYLGRVVEAGPTEEVLRGAAAPLHAGAAVGRARDRAARAGRARRARSPTRPGSRPAAGSTRAARRSPTGRRRRPGSTTPAARTPLAVLPATRDHRCACHLVAARDRAGGDRSDHARHGRRPAGRAARARCTSTRRRSRVERDAVLFGEWFCVGRLDDLGLAEPGRVAVVDVVGESVLVTSDEEGAPARGVQRLPAPRLPAVPGRARAPSRSCTAAGSLRCPYHSWTYALDGRLLRAPHADGRRDRPAGVRAAPGRRSRTWAGFVFVHLDARGGRAARRRRSRGRRRRWRNYAMGDLVTGLRLHLRGARPTTRCSPRTTTSATTAARCTPSCAGWCRRSPAAATDLDWDERHPAPRGRLDVHDDRHHRPARRCPGLDEAERTRHKGELVYPNLMLSALGRPRRGVRAAAAVRSTAPGSSCSLLFARRRGRRRRLRPVATPATCGTWSTSRTGRSASRCSAGMSSRAYTPRLVRADGGRQRRHPALAAAAAGRRAADD